MPTQFDLDNARNDDISGLPEDMQELYQRLEQDGTNLRETIAQINQRLQKHIAQFSATRSPANPVPEPLAAANAPAPAPRAIEITWRAPRYTTMRRWVTALATVAIVIAFIVALSVNARLRSGGPSSRQTRPVIDLSDVPLTPVATPGPAAKWLQQVTTALHRQGNCVPVDPTSRFHVGDTVWVFVILKQDLPGHTITVRWYMNGNAVEPPQTGPGHTAQELTSSNAGSACFGILIPKIGTGMARIYWDLPANDTSDSPTDPALMATITFAVLPPGYSTPTSNPTGTTAPTYANPDSRA